MADLFSSDFDVDAELTPVGDIAKYKDTSLSP